MKIYVRPIAPVLLFAPLLLLQAGCGSPHAADQEDATPVADSSAPATPLGPFDSTHEDAAIAAAIAAARKSPGHPSLANPQAYFQPYYPSPQAPGHPLVTPIYGWLIGFTATFHDNNDDASSTMPPDPVTQPHLVGSAIPVLAARAPDQDVLAPRDPLATTPSPATPYQQPGSAMPPPGTVADPTQAPLNITHPDQLPNPGIMLQAASSSPTEAPRIRNIRPLNVFVAVDGTIKILPN